MLFTGNRRDLKPLPFDIARPFFYDMVSFPKNRPLGKKTVIKGRVLMIRDWVCERENRKIDFREYTIRDLRRITQCKIGYTPFLSIRAALIISSQDHPSATIEPISI